MGRSAVAQWTADAVATRFAEAVETAYKLPRVRVQGYFNPWTTFAFQMSERYPDPAQHYRPLPPTPEAVERMLETMRWVQWLEVEQRHLIWMRARQCEWRVICRRFGCERSTAWRRWQKALHVVAQHLNTGPTIPSSG